MAIEFNFNRLQNLYIATLHSFDKAMAFDIEIGRGRFLFMMYLSDEDKESKDMLFVYMRNTRILRKIKMYGNHKKGDFKVFINEEVKNRFIQELQLIPNGGGFDFICFLNQLNENIPLEITQDIKVRTLRNNRDIIRTLNVIDEAEKTVLIGDRHLSVGTPQDKTLRKLYLYTNASAEDVTHLIKLLKKLNRTVAWTTEDNNYRVADIREMINSLNGSEN